MMGKQGGTASGRVSGYPGELRLRSEGYGDGMVGMPLCLNGMPQLQCTCCLDHNDQCPNCNSEQTEILPMSNTAVNIIAAFHIFI